MIDLPPLHPQPQPIAEFLAGDDGDAYDWLVPGLLEAGDRIILTGNEGKGKSTLLRQLAVQLASGVHPFTLDRLDPIRVLYLDAENSIRQTRRHLRRLTEHATADMAVHLDVLIANDLDLLRTDDRTWLLDLAGRVEPQVVIAGPLYKLATGDPTTEMTGRAITAVLDGIRITTGAALILEAHTPYSDGGGRNRPIRPYGWSGWSRWPEFGIYLADDGKLVHWRGPRDERQWPAQLTRSAGWPWEPVTPTPKQSWDGPTNCIAAILDVLAREQPGTQLSTTKLAERLMALGKSFHKRTVAAAVEVCRGDGRLIHSPGPRNADLWSLPRHDGMF